MSKVFEIDYKRLVVLVLPTFLRKPVLFALLKALTRPVVVLYDIFLTNRTDNIYKANTTGQVCYMRGMLNDAFDPDLRRCYVSDGVASDWHFLYKNETFNTIAKGQPIYAGSADSTSKDSLGNTTLIFNKGNTGVTMISKQGAVGSSGIDFVIMGPMSLRGIIDENRLTALVNYYKLASKRYSIQYF